MPMSNMTKQKIVLMKIVRMIAKDGKSCRSRSVETRDIYLIIDTQWSNEVGMAKEIEVSLEFSP